MKKHIYLFCALLASFFIATTINAQTISYNINMPNSSTLLQRIVGGTLIPIPQGSGIINNGDAIAMQLVYPNAGLNNGYKFNVSTLPGTATALQWSVSGDLTIVGPATGTNVTIKHLDVIDRGTNTMDSAQSKGRIAFSYGSTIPGCGGRTVIAFDVYKIFNGTNNSAGGTTGMLVVPAITGPGCLLSNKQYTYSVDPIVSDNLNAQIGMDRYFWDVASLNAAGMNVDYYSTDSSSITFTTGSSVPPTFTLRCGMGLANYFPLQTTPSQQAYAEKTILASAGIPTVTLSGAASGVITTSTPFCINTNGSTVTPLTFTVTPQAGASYSWTFGTVGAFGTGSVNDWNTSPVQPGAAPYTISGVNTFTVTNIFNQPGVVMLTVTDACGTVTNYNYQIKRTLTAADANLITIANNCLLPGGSSAVSIATAPAVNEANLNTLTWATLSGWTLSAASINPSGTVAPGVYTLNASFSGCTSSVPYTVNVKPATVTITSPSPLCFPRSTPGNSVSATPSAASGYTWSTTAGSITGTSSSASLTTVTTSPFNLTATYTVAPGCSTASAATPADLQPITPSYSLPTCINSAAFDITVTNYPGYGTYTLNYVSGTNLVGSYTVSGGIVTVTPNGLSGSGVYKLTHVNGACGTASTNVTITPTAAPFTVSVLFNNGSIAVIGASTNAYQYTWYNCSTNTALGTPLTNPTPPGTTSWTLGTPGAANYYFGAEAVVSAGCTTRVCVNVPGYLARQHGGGITSAPDMPASVGSISPNPNNGEFTIEIKNVTKEAAADIYDMNGKFVNRTNLTTGANRISNLNIAAGQYIIALQVDGTYYIHKMTVTK